MSTDSSPRMALPQLVPSAASAERRRFLQLFAALAAQLAQACGPRAVLSSDSGDATSDGADTDATDSSAAPPAHVTGLPMLGGAPDTLVGHAIACLCDTVIPGAHRDPTGAPGAIDARVPALFFDRALPAAALVGLIRVVLDGVASEVGGRPFARLSIEQRETALQLALDRVPEAEFAVQLVRLGYFASPVAARHLGYPGPNPGYRSDPDFSFGEAPLAREVTLATDGNYP
ncbi:MAG: hypothetical protein U0269_19460 [Polyangiales bacterium]